MLDIPLDLLGLIALLAGGAAWILAGALNKWMEPSLPTADASRIKAFVSLAVLVTCALVGFFVLNAIRHTAGRMCKFYKYVGVTERPDGERFSDHKRRTFARQEQDKGGD
jgi:hypothetical protein